jgi:hypothetical protein
MQNQGLVVGVKINGDLGMTLHALAAPQLARHMVKKLVGLGIDLAILQQQARIPPGIGIFPIGLCLEA